MQSKFNTRKMVGMAIFIAIVVVLQVLASFIRFGTFSIQLVMIPIVVGAALYGPAAGAILGAAFGVVVLINTINGTDVGAFMLWGVNPVVTAVFIMLKGTLAGYTAGLVYVWISKRKQFVGVLSAAFIAPVVNTGLFLFAMAVFYRDTLILWAGDSSLLYYSFITLAGVNFLLELGVNIVLAPVIVRIIRIGRKT